MRNFFYFCLALSLSCFADSKIHDHGYWIGTDIMDQHAFDRQLGNALVDFFKQEKAETIVDFGCGPGEYVKLLRENGLNCIGYDGNPETPEISGGVAEVIDLSIPINLEKRFDWVLSLEVGEHLPKKFEKIFVENLHKHNIRGIVLSWAVKGQGGFGHFNCQNNDYVKTMMAEYGYTNDVEAEEYLRKLSFLPWFKNTVMVFRR